MLALLVWSTTVAAAESNFADRWVGDREDLQLGLERDEALQTKPLRVLIGTTDVTGLISVTGPGQLLIRTSLIGLPRGESDVVVYLEGRGGAWTEHARLPLKVRGAAGFDRNEFRPRVQLTGKSQLDENTSGASPPPERSTYQDFAQNLGFDSSHQRGGFTLRTRFNAIGSSVRSEALRFGVLGEDAPKLDLADYLVEVEHTGWVLGLGHVSAGQHPLLVNGLASRGLQLRRSFAGGRFDLSAASVNGQSIVGYNNLFGINYDDDNYVTTSQLGFEALPGRPGALRLELSWMDATRASLPGFDIGEVPDAERSHGLGATLYLSTPQGRVNGSASFARSEYTNPRDPFLAEGDELIPVREEMEAARELQLNFALLQNAAWLGMQGVNANLNLRHQRIDPLYGSLGAFVRPDTLRNELGLGLKLGQVYLQGRAGASEDNLDDIPTILKTVTRDHGLDATLPLAALFGADTAPSIWWPSVTLSAGRVQQYAGNMPPPDESDFNSASHLPDQVTETFGTTLNWNLKSFGIGYSVAYSKQDNRQPGREFADFDNLNHGLSLSWQPGTRFFLSANLGAAANGDRENALDRYTDSASLSVNANLSERITLIGSYNIARNHDSQANAEDRMRSLNAALSGSFELPVGGWRRLPMQVFVSFSRQQGESVNRLFGFTSDMGAWTLNSGFNIGL
jgi:hypothetical protein